MTSRHMTSWHMTYDVMTNDISGVIKYNVKKYDIMKEDINIYDFMKYDVMKMEKPSFYRLCPPQAYTTLVVLVLYFNTLFCQTPNNINPNSENTLTRALQKFSHKHRSDFAFISHLKITIWHNILHSWQLRITITRSISCRKTPELCLAV